MAEYYKVPKKIVYEDIYDEEGNVIGQNDTVAAVMPDIPSGINFIGSVVGENYFIKVNDGVVIENGIKLVNVPEQLLKSKVRRVK